MIEFRKLTDEWASDWDQFVYASPDAWLYGLSAWQKTILNVARWQLIDESFGLVENSRLKAVIPLQYSGMTTHLSSSGWGGCGPILSPELGDTDRQRITKLMIDRCIEIARQHEAPVFDFFQLPVTRSNLENNWGVNPYVFFGFSDESRLSQVAEISPDTETLWKNLSTNARRKIKKARNCGIRVRKVSWPEYLDDYYRIHCETYERTGVEPHPKAYFEGIATQIAPLGHVHLFQAVSEDDAFVAYRNDISFNGSAYYHMGCSRNDFIDKGVNYLLQWEAVQHAAKSAIRWYDYGDIFPLTTDKKLAGLTKFKSRFGGQPHRAFRCELKIPQEGSEASPPEPRLHAQVTSLFPRIKALTQAQMWSRLTRKVPTRHE